MAGSFFFSHKLAIVAEVANDSEAKLMELFNHPPTNLLATEIESLMDDMLDKIDNDLKMY